MIQKLVVPYLQKDHPSNRRILRSIYDAVSQNGYPTGDMNTIIDQCIEQFDNSFSKTQPLIDHESYETDDCNTDRNKLITMLTKKMIIGMRIFNSRIFTNRIQCSTNKFFEKFSKFTRKSSH
ncbi:Catalase-peroxidase [Dirofilaria immitis]